jgi:hypothetical protein
MPIINTTATFEFYSHDPISRTAVLPEGIDVEVLFTDNGIVDYTTIGLTDNSLPGAIITSAWQVNTSAAAANINISALGATIGNIEVSASDINGTTVSATDGEYRFVVQVTTTPPIILISNNPSTKLIDPDPVIATVHVISPGYNDINSFGLMLGSVGTILTSGVVNQYIPYPNETYTIEISGTGSLMVSADDIFMNSTSAEDGVYVNYQGNPVLSCSGRELDLVNLLPRHLRYGETGEFMAFFEEFLNNMYHCKNSDRYDSDKQDNANKISILEKIFRLSTLHDADTIDMDYIQFFASYLGYNINISRGNLGNLTNTDLTSYNTNGTDPDIDISDSEVSQRYLRFAVRNLPTWYRIKTTRNAIKVMLFSFGLVGDILTNYTAPIEDGGYTNDESKWLTFDDRYADSSLSSQIPTTWFGTPHFSIAIDYDQSPPNWFKQIPLILDAIESIRPINTVLDEISTVLERQTFPISVKAVSRFTSTSYFKGAFTPEPYLPVIDNALITDNNEEIISDDGSILYWG